MRKPIKLTGAGGTIAANFGSGAITKQVPFRDPDGSFSTDFDSASYITPPQSDWAQDDPTEPDYVKNKYIAEQYRPITVNGEEFLSEERNSGALDIVGEGGIIVTPKENSLHLSVEDYVEGDAIDIEDDGEGKKVISVEEESLNDKHIAELSIAKITQKQGETLILYGGDANGWN